MDGNGNVYVADTENSTIRKVTSAGVVTTLAGTAGSTGSTDGTGSAARFHAPIQLARDANGIIYVADSGNETIRKVTAAGVVTTLAGSAGMVGSTDGTGSAARFDQLQGVAVDQNGNVYVGDTFNTEIRKVTPAAAVTTLAGTTFNTGTVDGSGMAARFDGPYGVAVDSSGNVYVADNNNQTIRKITPAGAVTTLAGSAGMFGSTDGTGSAARFGDPQGLTVDSNGNIYVADRENETIRKVTSAGVVTTLAGSPGVFGSADGTGAAAQFSEVYGVAVDSNGNVYVADTVNCTIRKITPAGVVTTLAGSAAAGAGFVDGTGSAARFDNPMGIAVDTNGNIYVADTNNSAIRKVTPAGVVTTLAGNGTAGAVDGTGSGAEFSAPEGVAVDAFGNLYVSDSGNGTIRKVTSAGVVSTIGGNPQRYGAADGVGPLAIFTYPTGIAISSQQILYFADYDQERIVTGRAVAYSDFNGDSHPDYLLALSSGGAAASSALSSAASSSGVQTAIWHLKGVSILSQSYGPTLPSGWTVVQAADFDGDGKADYLLFNGGTLQTAIWYMNDTAHAGGAYGPTLPSGWTIAGVGDFNGDGMTDFVLFNAGTLQTAIWYMNGPTHMGGAYGPTLPSGWTLMGVADINGDGMPDFVLFNTGTLQTAIWYMNGPTHTGGVYGPTLPSGWTLSGVADFNGDTHPDFVLFNAGTLQTAIWYMNGPTHTGGAYGPTLPSSWRLVAP